MSERREGFARAAVREALARAPKDFAPYRTRAFWTLGQIYTGNPDLHYEVWRRAKLGVVELGLHFEADPLTNARLLAAFRARAHEIRHALGDRVAIESWDKGWARVFEAIPLTDQEELARRCAERLAAYLRALEPILREELPDDVPWQISARATAGARRPSRPRAPRPRGSRARPRS